MVVVLFVFSRCLVGVFWGVGSSKVGLWGCVVLFMVECMGLICILFWVGMVLVLYVLGFVWEGVVGLVLCCDLF